jgi:hypothetical protein
MQEKPLSRFMQSVRDQDIQSAVDRCRTRLADLLVKVNDIRTEICIVTAELDLMAGRCWEKGLKDKAQVEPKTNLPSFPESPDTCPPTFQVMAADLPEPLEPSQLRGGC